MLDALVRLIRWLESLRIPALLARLWRPLRPLLGAAGKQALGALHSLGVAAFALAKFLLAGPLKGIAANKLASSVVVLGVVVIAALLATIEERKLPAPEPEPEDRPAYRIGAIVSLTGEFERRGNNMLRGYNIAVQAVNDSGGVRVGDVPHNLKLVVYDDESSPVRAREVAELMFQHDDPPALLAPYSSALALPAIRVAVASDTPVIAPVASSAGFSETLPQTFTLQTPPQAHLIEAARLFAVKVDRINASIAAKEERFAGGEKPKVVLAAANDRHSREVMGAVAAALRKAGIEQIESFDLGVSAERYAEDKARLQNLDAMFVAAYAQGPHRLLETVATEGINIPFLAMTHCDIARLTSLEPTAAEGALCAVHWQQEALFQGSPPLEGNKFATAFYEAYGTRPTHHSAAAAAAIQVLFHALRNSENAGVPLGQALAQTRINTFYGPIDFDGSGANIAKPMVLSQISRSRYIPVGPPSVAVQEANFSRPQLASAKQ